MHPKRTVGHETFENKDTSSGVVLHRASFRHFGKLRPSRPERWKGVSRRVASVKSPRKTEEFSIGKCAVVAQPFFLFEKGVSL